jgi:hypothetical protein
LKLVSWLISSHFLTNVEIEKRRKSYLSISKSGSRFVKIQILEKLFNDRTNFVDSGLGFHLDDVGVGEDPVPSPEVAVGHAFRKAVLVEPDRVQNLGAAQLKKTLKRICYKL